MRKFFIRLLMITFCVLCFCGCSSGDTTEETGQTTIQRKPGTPADSEEDTEEEDEDTLYMVQSFNCEEEKVILRSLNYNNNYVFKYTLNTTFFDKYGDTTSSINFIPGSIVTIGDRRSDGSIESLQMSDDVWTFTDIQKYEIDTDNGILELNDTNYKLTDSTAVFSNDVEGTLTDIGTEDVLTVVGMDKEILSIVVTTGHGYITFSNTDKFDGSLVYIGSKIITMVSKDMTVTVPEGSYDVTVANDGYGGTKTVEVVRNETTLLDLSELEGEGPKTCKLTVTTTTVAESAIYLDGTEIENGKETEVKYGKHTLSISVEGYDTWTKTLYVNSETANISVDPTESDTSSNSSESSSSSSSTDSSDTNGNSSNSSSDTTNSSSSTDSSDSTNSSTDSSSSTSDSTDSELDYLSTLSDLISTLSGTSD